MHKPTLMSALFNAVLLSIGTAGLYGILELFMEPLTAGRLTIIGSGYVYLLCLLRLWCGHAGATLLFLLSSVTLAVTYWQSNGLLPPICAVVVSLWVVRSLRAYRSPLVAMADLTLCVFSACVAIRIGVDSGSVALGSWCFYLTQSLWVLLPEHLSLAPKRQDLTADRQFEMAAAAALSAVVLLKERQMQK